MLGVHKEVIHIFKQTCICKLQKNVKNVWLLSNRRAFIINQMLLIFCKLTFWRYLPLNPYLSHRIALALTSKIISYSSSKFRQGCKAMLYVWVCLCDNWKPSSLHDLVFNWRTFSRRITARWWRQWAKNQVLTNQNSRIGGVRL